MLSRCVPSHWDWVDVLELSTVSPFINDVGISFAPQHDRSRTGLFIPQNATTNDLNRYLFRLCGAHIPQGIAFRLKGLRQMATIAGTAINEAGDQFLIPPLQQTSPIWSFSDANISWHLRWFPRNQATRTIDPAMALSGTSSNYYGVAPALMFSTISAPPDYGAGYIAPANGSPPGHPIGSLGTFHDIRFPWVSQATKQDLDIDLIGPGAIAFYASVRQTNPLTRMMNPITDPALLANMGLPEEAYITGNLTQTILTRYFSVAGAMIIDIFNVHGTRELPQGCTTSVSHRHTRGQANVIQRNHS